MFEITMFNNRIFESCQICVEFFEIYKKFKVCLIRRILFKYKFSLVKVK